MKQKYPVAKIKIEGECFTGETQAIVVDSLVTDLIIGPKLCNWTRQESRTEGTGTSGTSDVVSNVSRSVPYLKNSRQVDKQCLAEKDGRDDVIGRRLHNSAANKNGGVLIVESETEKIAGCNACALNEKRVRTEQPLKVSVSTDLEVTPNKLLSVKQNETSNGKSNPELYSNERRSEGDRSEKIGCKKGYRRPYTSDWRNKQTSGVRHDDRVRYRGDYLNKCEPGWCKKGRNVVGSRVNKKYWKQDGGRSCVTNWRGDQRKFKGECLDWRRPAKGVYSRVDIAGGINEIGNEKRTEEESLKRRRWMNLKRNSNGFEREVRVRDGYVPDWKWRQRFNEKRGISRYSTFGRWCEDE